MFDTPAAAFQLGNACLARGAAAEAIAAFTACLRLRPTHPAALFNLANAQLQAGAVVDSAETLLRCLRCAPGFGPAYVNLSHVLLRLGLVQQACAVAADATRLVPESVEAWLALGLALHHGGDHAGAVAAYQAALHLAPRHAGALSSLGNTLRAMGRIQQALSAHDAAVAASPAAGPVHAAARFHRATTLLAAGDYAAGWAEYEWRWACTGRAPRSPAPPWHGEPLAGQTILLHAEQGLGDTLQFVRYAPLVAARGGRVVLQAPPPLVRLLSDLPGISAVLSRDDPLPPFDQHCPLLSLPLAFGTELHSVPAPPAYLRADAAHIAAWRQRLPPGDGPAVGLAWAGLPNLDDWQARLIDTRRSLEPSALAGLAGLTGIRFISLQKDRPAPAIDGLPMFDAMEQMRDFADTAALVATLDLVIAVDTAVAHLAAALGRPVWLLSRYDGCWRWLHDRADSPWYPTMRIYRQARPFAWPAVIAQVRQDLEHMLCQRQRAAA